MAGLKANATPVSMSPITRSVFQVTFHRPPCPAPLGGRLSTRNSAAVMPPTISGSTAMIFRVRVSIGA